MQNYPNHESLSLFLSRNAREGRKSEDAEELSWVGAGSDHGLPSNESMNPSLLSARPAIPPPFPDLSLSLSLPLYFHLHLHLHPHSILPRLAKMSRSPQPDDQASTNYKEAFSLFDRRGSGTVSLELLGDLLRACGQNPTQEEIAGLEKNLGGDCT